MKISRTIAAAIVALSFSQAHALDLQLKDKQFRPYQIGFAADGARACIAGGSFDADAAQSSGELMVVDYKSSTVLWNKHIAAPDGNVSLTSAQCAFDGENVYLLANVDTQRPRSLNQTLVYIYQFSAAGKQLGYKELLLEGRNKYGYAIAPAGAGMQIAGYIKDEDEDNEYYSLFTATIDRHLETGKVNIRKTGAFGSSAAARFVGESLYIANFFFPAKLSKKDGLDYYANSRVLVNGGYAWSMRPFKQEPRDVKAGISQRGVIYSLADKYGSSTVAVTSAEGKQISLVSYEGKFCETESLAEYGNSILAVRQPCSGKGRAELLSIAPATGRETPLHLVAGEPILAATNDGRWFLLSKNGKGNLFLDVGEVRE